MAIKEFSMDPWSPDSVITDSNISSVIQSFEDNFNDLNNHKSCSFNKLPDSCEYLTKLTKQLDNITLNPNLLKELADKKESCMQQLLSSSKNYESEDFSELDEPICESSVLRTLAPEKQALTKGELAELIKYDQLKINTE